MLKRAAKLKTRKSDFIQILHTNQGIIKSLCNAYYPDAEDRKDVFQDIVLQLWKSFETFRGESNISTWIYSVSLHTILRNIRKDKARIITESIDSSTSEFEAAMANDDVELLNLILRRLDGLDKAIVILLLEGYKNKEIAGILEITPTNVSTRLNRIKSDLKEKFKITIYESNKA